MENQVICISIIVPVYNVEAYLSKCIESILCQTFADFELILVDDGSPDHCGEIIDEYAKEDARIVALHQSNKGVSAARNVGIDISKGKYISFIDPDDYVSKDFLQVLVEGIKNEDADIACCNWDSFSDTAISEYKMRLPDSIMDRNEWLSHFFDRPRTIGGSNWNKLFRRDLLKYKYDEALKIGEDRLFLLQNSIHIKKAVYINQVLYHIYERPNSAIRADNTKLIQGLDAEKQILKFLQNEDITLFQLAEAEYLDRSLLLFNQFKIKSPETAALARSHIHRYLHKNWKSVLTNKEINFKLKILYLMV